MATTTTTMQSLQTEIVELRTIVKDQAEQLKRNETIMGQLVNALQTSKNGNNAINAEEESDDDDEEEEEEEDDEEESDDDDEEYELRNHSYEERLNALEQFVRDLEKKVLIMEKKQSGKTE